ncbi:unnamed protein product [Cladocopium goreaui]|uniref:RNase H type-1 domain-containing protein n=1 Tax=Cladocopium goreaui TaxID=2562237 RepID=A0A9P1G9N9_9DINO|nr:unnamed protein product [Cladocopium goreaui]
MAGSDAVLMNWSHSFTFDPDYTPFWEASIRGLDLAWEMGTLLMTPSSSFSSMSLRPKRSRAFVKRVTFEDEVEIYVGHEVSRSRQPEGEAHPSRHSGQDLMEYDEVSWMSAGWFADNLQHPPHLNRDAAAVFHHQHAVHQDDMDMEEPENTHGEEGASSSSDSDSEQPRRPAIVYTVDMNPMHCRPRWDSYEKLHKDIAYQFDMSIHDITIIHAVQSVPLDLLTARVQPFIAQKPGDVTEGSTFQLVLIDVEFHNAQPSMEPESVRRVKLFPMTVSRKAIIAMLGLEAHCRYVRKACLMWHNGQPVRSQSKSLVNFLHGDYLRVAVPPGRGELRDYHTRDVAQCFRRGYRASNIPTVLEALPDGIGVADMPVIDHFNYIPKAQDLDYDRDAMALFQLPGWSLPAFDYWPPFLSSRSGPPVTTCKVNEHDVREPEMLADDPMEIQEGGRPELDFGDTTAFLQELHPLWIQLSATEREDEGRVLYVRTWYSDHDRFPHCESDRPVRLLSDPWRWLDTIAEAWDDRVDPDARLDLFIVKPTPGRGSDGPRAVPHVIIVQHPRAALSSIHVTKIDTYDSREPKSEQVTVGPRQLRKHFFLQYFGLLGRNAVESLIDCMIWHGDHLLDHTDLMIARHGDSFLVINNHLRDIVAQAASQHASTSSSSLNLLQTQSVVLRKSDIDSDSYAEKERATGRALQLVWRFDKMPHPSYIEVSAQPTREEIQWELNSWGLSWDFILCLERDAIICLPAQVPSTEVFQHYVFVHTEVSDDDWVFLHSSQNLLTPHEILCHLYALGFWRAVILKSEQVYSNITKITFQNQKVSMAPPVQKAKPPLHWPVQQHGQRGPHPFFKKDHSYDSKQLVRTGLTSEDISVLFASQHDLLRTDVADLDLPEEIKQAVAQCDATIANDELDRLLIYADGSSLGTLKQTPPLRAEEEGTGDTWAFLVLGERYDPPGLKFIGWNAHAVHYDSCSNMHVGAHRIGADVAEKEGLAWAAFWRISQNWNIATCFRSDSRTALGQAAGQKGTADMDGTFTFLRGTFQAVEAALAPEEVLYSHVPGHAGEVWNEFCDWLAKQERIKSHYCPRPKFDMSKWRAAVGYVWMLFNSQPDVPLFCGHGLHAPAPDLPPQQDLQQVPQQPTKTSLLKFSLSACTANVGSLSGGPDGHAGKVQYMRKQFSDLKFNFLGLQETRTQEFCSCVDQIYRLASGCAGRHQGVELWVNLSQPYGYLAGQPCLFTTEDFRIVYKDARILLVHVETIHWRCWILVAYAPQSGIALREREDWWQQLHQVLHHRCLRDPLIVLIDANASPGAWDQCVVFTEGLHTSSGTPLLREFSIAQELFMPSTTEAHQGPRETWTDPQGCHSYCIDYVLLSSHFREACAISKIVPELDISPGVWDHEATAVELSWTEYIRAQLHPDVVKTALQRYEPGNWSTDIVTHIDQLNQSVLQGIRDICPPPRRLAKKPFVSDELWQLRAEKLSAKARLKSLAKRRREESLVVLFGLWKTHADLASNQPQQAGHRYWHYMSYLDLSNLRLVGQYYHTSRRLRQGLRQAKGRLIQQQFEDLPDGAPASQILKMLRPLLGPSNLKKLKQTTLPFVRKENGDVCILPNEAVEVWLNFFSKMEGGVRMDLHTQRELWISNLAALRQHEFDIAAEELPRLLDLEAALRRVNPSKATGPDQMHPGICGGAPQILARKLFGPLMKLVVHGQEALQHKGGLLHPVWKAKGRKDCCASYRSILISSHIGKSIHRSIRQHQTTLFTKFLQQEQLGGRPRVPVTLGVHIGRAFMRAKKRHSSSFGRRR